MQIAWAFKGEALPGRRLARPLPAQRVRFADPVDDTAVGVLAVSRTPDRGVAGALALPVPRRVRLDFEHLVSSPARQGRASHTDLMALSAEHAIAIEAKWTEPRYPIVRDGSASRRTEGSTRRWCDLLRRRAGWSGPREGARRTAYQMVHRAASACHPEDVSRACMVYMVFEPTAEKRAEYLEDLGRLRDILGTGSSLSIAYVQCSIEQSRALGELRRRWDLGSATFGRPCLRA